MGTMVMAAGLKRVRARSLWNIENPPRCGDSQARLRGWFRRGSHQHLAGMPSNWPTGAWPRNGKDHVEAARLAREACPAGKFVAGTWPHRKAPKNPCGGLAIEEAEEAFFRQAQALVKGGVDLISIETMFSFRRRLPHFVPRKTGAVTVIAALTFNRTKKGFFTHDG